MMSPWWRVVLCAWPRALPTLLIVLLLFPSPQLQAHDVGPPLVTITPRRRIQLVPWTWEHWWEANRDLYLVPLLQAAAEEQEPSPEELAKLREDAADALEKACRDNNEVVRLKAVIALGELGLERSLPVVKALADDRHPDVRRAAVLALGLIGSADAADALQQTLTSAQASGELKGSALIALGLCPTLDETARRHLRLRAQDAALGRRLALVGWGLCARRSDARPLWGLLLEEADYVAAAYALVALGQAGERQTTTSLGQVLADSEEVSLKSVEELKRSIRASIVQPRRVTRRGLPPIVDPTSTEVEEDRIYLARVRGSAAIALGELGDRSGDEALLSALLEEKPARYDLLYRSFAAIALGQIGSERTVGHVLSFINDPKVDADDSVRGFAILALGLYARPRETPQGRQLPSGTRKALAGIEALLSSGKEPPEAQSAAAMAAALSTDASFIPTLRQTLRQAEDIKQVGYTLLALGMLGDKQSLDSMKQFLVKMQGRVDSEAVCAQRAAVLGMGCLRMQAAVPELRKAFHYSYYVNREVVHALALMRTYSVVDDFKKCLAHDKPLARAFGAEALGLLLRRDDPPAGGLSCLLAGHNFTVKDDEYRLFQALANEYLYDEMLGQYIGRWR